MDIQFKKCSNLNCIHGNELQPITNFYQQKDSKSGYRSQCKDCILQKDKEYYQKNKNKKKEYQKNNKNKKNQEKLWRNEFSKYSTYYDKLKTYEECRQDPENPELLQVKCKYCGEWFNPTNLMVSNRLSAIIYKYKNRNRDNNFYCSNICKNNCILYNSKGKIWLNQAKFNRILRYNIMQDDLSIICFLFDNYTCQKCGKSKEEYPNLILHAHHTVPLVYDPYIASDLWITDNERNVITYCDECHSKIHKNINCNSIFLNKYKYDKDILIKMMNTN